MNKRDPTTLLSDEQKDMFCLVLSARGNVTRAALAAGIDRTWAYQVREKDAEFAELWDNAMQAHLDGCEDEIVRRGFDGIRKAVFWQGIRVDGGKVRQYSDNLAMFYLKRYRPEFRDNQQININNNPQIGPFQQIHLQRLNELPDRPQPETLAEWESQVRESRALLQQSSSDAIIDGEIVNGTEEERTKED